MSKNDLPHPPSTLPQIAGVFSSITHATNEIFGGNPGFVAEVQNLYKAFLSSPTTIKILGFDPTSPPKHTPPSDPLRKEILTETITALSKAVTSLQPKAGAAKAPTTPNTPTPPKGTPKDKGSNPGAKTPQTYASLATSPARPSAVLEMGQAQITNRLPPMVICNSLNKELASSPHSQVRIAAARWTMRGNLVITAGHATTSHHLNSALTYIAFYIKKTLDLTDTDTTKFPIRANVKWL
jgi:hypothetical protein